VLARFGFWFTVAALLLAAIGALVWWPDWRMSVSVATAVLIIACPCAFTLAAPIALGTATGVLGRAGLFVKEPSVVLELARVNTIVLDKTGTLTTTAVGSEPVCEGLSARDWALVRRLAAESVHPVSRAIEQNPGAAAVTDFRETVGRGLVGWVDGHRVAVGSAAFIAAETGRVVPNDRGVTWASVDNGVPGWIRTAAGVRPGVAAALARLSTRYETRLLSGDHDTDRARWAEVFSGRVQFRQLPDDKLAAVKTLLSSGRHVLMVGDGLNDAGAFAAANVGLAATDDTACLVPACDAVISGTRLADLPELLAYVSRTRRVIALCFAVSIEYNAIGLWLALTGQLTPHATAILMPVSSLTIVGLSTGLMRTRLPEVLR
jgi:Cu+-exporting ATPase